MIRVLKQNKSDGHGSKIFNTALTLLEIFEFCQDNHGNSSDATLTPDTIS